MKLYIVLPHSSVECERGFSAQNRIKSKVRSRPVERLELLMRISLAHRHGGMDFTSEQANPFLGEAVNIWLDAPNIRRDMIVLLSNMPMRSGGEQG